MSLKLSEGVKALNGIRIRVAAFVFITALVSLILTGVLISKQVLDFHRREFDKELYNLALDLAQEVRYDFLGLPIPPLTGFSFGKRSLPFQEDLSFYQVIVPDGTILYQSRNLLGHRLPWSPMDLATVLGDEVVYHVIPAAHLGHSSVKTTEYYRLISIPLRYGNTIRGILEMAVPLEEIEREQEALSHLFFVLIPIFVGGLAFGSYSIAGRALLPLRELIERTRAITPGDLSVRLPEPETGDEIAELSRTLNHLLVRLQSSFESQERFIADASHQLRTPLAILQGEIELLQGKSPSPEQLKEFLGIVHEEVRHLSKLVEGLLILARVSSLPEAALVPSSVRIDELLIGLIERYQSTFKNRGLKCRFQISEDAALMVQGDEDLLRSLFETLLENALKYSPQGGVIEVSLQGSAVLIKDEGKGIPENQREKVFERFYRGDRGSKGFGLGLTIAKQIAEAHGAKVSILKSDENSGTCIEVRLQKTNE